MDLTNDKLKGLREASGKSLRQVGKETGLHFEYIRLFENKEKCPDDEQKEILEKYYDTDLTEYFRSVTVTMLLKKARKTGGRSYETEEFRKILIFALDRIKKRVYSVKAFQGRSK